MNSAVESPGEPLDPIVWKISGVVLLGPLMTSLDSTVVNVSLSTLGHELRVPLTTIQWVITGYLLALALMLPLSGWLVDRIGAKRVYLFCFTAFTLASLLCGVSTTAGFLIGARVLQGMAGGLIAPMAQMMTARAAGRHLARVMGIMVVPVLLGPICGPTLAGLILQHASWRWIFFINLPIGVLALILALWILPNDGGTLRPRSFDLNGFLLLSPGLVLLLYSLESFNTESHFGHLSLYAFVTAVGLLASFVLHARRLGHTALVDLSLFRNPTFNAAASTQFLANCIAFGGQMLLPLYLLSVQKITPAETGMLLAPAGFGMLFTYPAMGWLTEHFGSRRISATGAFIALLGTLPFVFFPPTGLPVWAIAATLFVRGVGLGGISLPSIAAAYASVSKEMIPVATTAINIVQRLGGPIATTLLATFLHAELAASVPSGASVSGSVSIVNRAFLNAPGWNAHAFSATFWLLCAFHAASILASLRLPLWARRHPASISGESEQAIEAITE